MAAQYDGTVRINTLIETGDFLKGLKKMSSQSKKLNNSISETSNQVNRLKKEITDLHNAPLESNSISKLSAEIDTIENKLDSLYEKRGMLEEDTASMFGGIGSKFIPDQAALQALMVNNSEWKKLTADIDKTEQSLEKYEKKLKQAQNTEQKKTDNQIARKAVQLEKACNKLDIYKTKLSEINGAESGIGKQLSKISDAATSGFSNIVRPAIKSNTILNKLSTSVTRFGKRLWGLLSGALIFSVITKGFTTLRQKIAETVKQNAQFSASMSQISANMNSVFNNLLSAAMPALNTIISAIAKATGYLSAFVALLTGKTIKSSNAAADAASGVAGAVGGVGEAAKKASEYLNGYDEMNVQTSKDNSGGSGGDGTGTGITYGDADVSSQVADFLDRIKTAWENADFTDLGRIVGNKINDALESINWTKIQETSYKIGKSIATFLNGVFETPGLFTNVGATVAEALNTAIELALGFSKNFHWDSFGQALADSINGFFNTFKFDKAAETVNTWLKGVLMTVTTLMKKTDFEVIGNKIGEFLSELDFLEIEGNLAKVLWEAIKAAFKLLKGLFEEAPLEASLIAAFAILKFTGLGSAVAGQISNTLSQYLATNGLSLALKGVGLVCVAEGISIALTGENDLKNSITATILSGLGTLMLTKNVNLSIIVTAAVAGWELGNNLYEKVPTIQNWADSLVELVLGDYSWSEIGQAISDGAVIDAFITPAIQFLSGDDTITTGEIINAMEQMIEDIVNDVSKKGTAVINFAIGIATKIADFVESVKKFKEATPEQKIEMIANLVSWVKDSKFGQTISGMTSSFSDWMKGSGFGSTISSMKASFSEWVKGSGFSSTISSLKASFTSWVKGDGFSNTINSLKASFTSWVKGGGFNSTISSLKASFTSWIKAKGFNNTITSMKAQITSFTDKIKNKALTFKANITGLTDKMKAFFGLKANGGVYTNGKWRPITQYASGGFPDMGQMFIARERGAELVGTLGGHTAVMNNDQIVSSVAEGVYKAVSAAMANGNSGTGDIYVYVGGQRITDYVIKDVKNRTIASGGVNPLLI